MSFSFLAPQLLWALLGIPLVILLHFIRARKKRYEVSALFLWKEAKELAATRRRFSPSWLLLLQIAFVALASLALSQPSFSFQGPPDRVLIIDASASMSARDSDGVRLDQAIREAKTLVRDSSRVAIIRAGLDAAIIQPLSTDGAAAEAVLNKISAGDREAQLDRAVSIALSIAPTGEIHIFTDSEAPSGQRIIVHPLSGDALNAGISTFDIGIQQVFVAVVSNHPRPQEIELELYREGEPVARSTLLVPANGQSNVTLPLTESSGFFEARLNTPDWDAMTLDNTAYAGKRNLKVVLNSADDALERALSAIPNLEFQVLPNAAADAPGFDVHIITGTLPANAKGKFLLFAPASDNPVYTTIRDWDRSDPLLRFVDLSDTVIGLSDTGLLFNDPNWRTLAQTGNLTPVLLFYKTETLELVAANFSPAQSDMINRTSFPLLITNIMNQFREEERLVLGTPLPADSVRLEGNRQIATERADLPGIYLVNGQRYSSSLLSATESRLPVSATVTASEPAAQTNETTERSRNSALWLIVLALLFLLAEWLLWASGRRAKFLPRLPRASQR